MVNGSDIVSSLVTGVVVIVRAFKTFKKLHEGEIDDEFLKFWVIFAFYSAFEMVFWPVLRWLPFFYFFKIAASFLLVLSEFKFTIPIFDLMILPPYRWMVKNLPLLETLSTSEKLQLVVFSLISVLFPFEEDAKKRKRREKKRKGQPASTDMEDVPLPGNFHREYRPSEDGSYTVEELVSENEDDEEDEEDYILIGSFDEEETDTLLREESSMVLESITSYVRSYHAYEREKERWEGKRQDGDLSSPPQKPPRPPRSSKPSPYRSPVSQEEEASVLVVDSSDDEDDDDIAILSPSSSLNQSEFEDSTDSVDAAFPPMPPTYEPLRRHVSYSHSRGGRRRKERDDDDDDDDDDEFSRFHSDQGPSTRQQQEGGSNLFRTPIKRSASSGSSTGSGRRRRRKSGQFSLGGKKEEEKEGKEDRKWSLVGLTRQLVSGDLSSSVRDAWFNIHTPTPQSSHRMREHQKDLAFVEEKGRLRRRRNAAKGKK